MTLLKLCKSKDEWDDYVLENGGHPLQLWGWGDVKSTHGWNAYRLQLHDDEKIIGTVQLLTRKLPWPLKSLAYVPRGPVVNEYNREELLDQLSNYVNKTLHSVVLCIEPDETDYNLTKKWKWRKSNNSILPAKTIILDLNKSETELLSEMSKKTRQYIRKSANEAISIKSVKNKDELQKCLEIYHATAKRAGFDIHADSYYFDIFEKLGDHSQVFAVYVDNKPISFLWIAISAYTAFELYGGMNDLGQQLRVSYALKWHVIKKCKEWGLTRYDFGGLIDGGVKTFKMGWCENETEMIGTLDLPLSKYYYIWNHGLPTVKMIARKFKKIFKR